ncbi:hypothetical protein E2C01_074006 [Portunus trituberculatus]|uniref:Uncharacterized protein n=1 Tax=Portunus trituberculatus TaxID=210409 RepID=A0A5B7ID66_PORTR|nr:hypothetical protein [Portunus trituberculatus]
MVAEVKTGHADLDGSKGRNNTPRHLSACHVGGGSGGDGGGMNSRHLSRGFTLQSLRDQGHK